MDCSDICKKISVDFQNKSDHFITYMLTHHTVQDLDFLFHVDLQLCSETHSSTSLCKGSRLMCMTVRIHKGVSYSRGPLQYPREVTWRKVKNCFSELILQNKATVADKCKIYNSHFLNQCTSASATAAEPLPFILSLLGLCNYPPCPISPRQNPCGEPQSHTSMFSKDTHTGQAQLHSDYFPISCSYSSGLIFQQAFNRAKEITTATIWWGLVSDPG